MKPKENINSTVTVVIIAIILLTIVLIYQTIIPKIKIERVDNMINKMEKFNQNNN